MTSTNDAVRRSSPSDTTDPPPANTGTRPRGHFRSLRTQQRAYPLRTRPSTFHTDPPTGKQPYSTNNDPHHAN
jgi:hypothetical protein